MRTSRHGDRPTRLTRKTRSILVTLAATGSVLLASCAEFDDTAAREEGWHPAPELTPESGPQPELPEADSTGPPEGPQQESSEPIPPPDGCTDHDPAVIATCLDPVSDVAALPAGGAALAALAAERDSGNIYRVAEDAEPREFTSLEVDTTGDGGLTGLALSPSFVEDELVFAYISTESDNRVVRFAEGEEPTPVLTGIPKGETGNAGALAHDGNGALLVATGNAGDPAEADDPDSLAGKVLRIDNTGEAAEGNPTADSPVISSGLHSPGDVCAAMDGSRSWVTDQGPDSDELYRIEPGEPLSTPAWTWDDQPGVAGCSDWSDLLMVTTAEAGNMQTMPVDEDGTITGEPQVSAEGNDGEQQSYGQLSGMDMLSEELAVTGTVNKDGGDPVSSDDRVVLVLKPEAEAGGAD